MEVGGCLIKGLWNQFTMLKKEYPRENAPTSGCNFSYGIDFHQPYEIAYYQAKQSIQFILHRACYLFTYNNTEWAKALCCLDTRNNDLQYVM